MNNGDDKMNKRIRKKNSRQKLRVGTKVYNIGYPRYFTDHAILTLIILPMIETHDIRISRPRMKGLINFIRKRRRLIDPSKCKNIYIMNKEFMMKTSPEIIVGEHRRYESSTFIPSEK